MIIGKNLLIVDDNEKNIFALKAVLKVRGYKVHQATSAAEGLRILKENAGIDLVLLDMMMPDMDGYQMVHIMKQDEKIRSLPVIAVTAQAMAGDKEKCLQAGVDAYITKPIDIDALLLAIESLI